MHIAIFLPIQKNALCSYNLFNFIDILLIWDQFISVLPLDLSRIVHYVEKNYP